MKVGVLALSTTKDREWKSIKETYLYEIFLKSFLTTYCQNHEYVIYVGIDKDDRIYSNPDELLVINKFISIMKNVTIEFIVMDDIPSGWLTRMWSKLMDIAYDNISDYFYHCGDDVQFQHKGWVSASIDILQ